MCLDVIHTSNQQDTHAASMFSGQCQARITAPVLHNSNMARFTIHLIRTTAGIPIPQILLIPKEFP
jgi:hypothetical protein